MSIVMYSRTVVNMTILVHLVIPIVFRFRPAVVTPPPPLSPLPLSPLPPPPLPLSPPPPPLSLSPPPPPPPPPGAELLLRCSRDTTTVVHRGRQNPLRVTVLWFWGNRVSFRVFPGSKWVFGAPEFFLFVQVGLLSE